MREMAGVKQNREMNRKRGIQREKVRARQLTDTAKTRLSCCLHYLLIHFSYIFLEFRKLISNFFPRGATLNGALATEDRARRFLFTNIHV